MYGWIFIALKQYSCGKLGNDIWENLAAKGEITEPHKPIHQYPDAQINHILDEIAKVIGCAKSFVEQDFGKFIGIHLVDMYWYMINPKWKTLDLLQNLQKCYNTLSNHKDKDFPQIECSVTGATKATLTYSSPRKMCYLAKGILEGISHHYREQLHIEEENCMLDGHSCCQMLLTITDFSSADMVSQIDSRMEKTNIDSASWQNIVTAPEKKQTICSNEWKSNVQIPGYEIIEKIGEGGMGIVYKAQQKSLNRFVAIKLIAPELHDNDVFIRRLEIEAKAMAQLQHPNIVSAIDFGFHNSCCYIVMEYIECRSLKSLIEQKKTISEKQVIDIGVAMASALTCLSKHQLVHRDINPSNILIEKNNNPKLADLGLVKDMQLDTQVTIADTWLGTPLYMSAEQIQSETDIDIRSDIYSLGSTLFYAVLGKTRFKPTKSIATVYHQMLSEPPILKEDLSNISDGLGCILHKCLQQNPDNRYQSPAEMERDLRFVKKGKDLLRTIHHKKKEVNTKSSARDSSRIHCVKGNDYFNQGNIEEAMQCYDKAIELDNKFSGAYCNRGKVHTIKDNFDHAVADYNEAIHCNPRLAKAYKNRGVIFYQTENYYAALADFHTYLELRPKALDASKIRLYIKECETKMAEED